MAAEITESARRFLRGEMTRPDVRDRALVERLDLLIELTQTTNQLLATLVELGQYPLAGVTEPTFAGQGDRHPLDPPPVTPVAEILPVDPPSAKRARAGRPAGKPVTS